MRTNNVETIPMNMLVDFVEKKYMCGEKNQLKFTCSCVDAVFLFFSGKVLQFLKWKILLVMMKSDTVSE